MLVYGTVPKLGECSGFSFQFSISVFLLLPTLLSLMPGEQIYLVHCFGTIIQS